MFCVSVGGLYVVVCVYFVMYNHEEGNYEL